MKKPYIAVKKNALKPAMQNMKKKVQGMSQMASAGNAQMQRAVIKDMESVKGPAPMPGKRPLPQMKPGGKK